MKLYGSLAQLTSVQLQGSSSGNTVTVQAPASASTITLTLPNSSTSDTLVAAAFAQALTNKTFDSTSTATGITMASWTPDGTHTLTAPAATDTLVTLAASQTLSNKTLASPAVSTYIDLTEQGSAPSSPAASTLRLYSDTNDALWVKNSSGTAIQVGSGSGQKNYLQASTNTSAGWNAYGTVSVTTDTTAADLPRATTTKTGWKLTPSGSTSGTFTVTIATPAVLTATAHGMQTGYAVTFSTTGALPTGLTAGTVYYVNRIDANTFNVATSMANLVAGTYVATSGTQSGTQSFTFGGAYLRFTLDAADYNVKQQLQHAQNILSGATGDWEVDVYSNTASNYSGTYTRLPLSTDSSGASVLPNLEGTYKTTFDAPGSAAKWIEVRYNLASANTHALVGSDLIVGPGTQVQGAAVTGWQNYTPTVNNAGSKVFTNIAQWRRVGETMEIRFNLAGNATASGSAGTTRFQMVLPTGYTINTAALPDSTLGNLDNVIGTVQTFGVETVAQFDRDTVAIADSSTAIAFVRPSTSACYQTTHLNSASAMQFQGLVTVPINEWAGSGTVNLAYTANPTSEVRVATQNGYGSTNTNIRRFSTLISSVGQDITYADSATLGGSFTIVNKGVYAITYTDAGSAACNMGISLNSSQLTTNIAAINQADRLTMMSPTGNDSFATCSTTVLLNPGDVIRAHTDAATATSSTARTQFTITKVAVDAGQAVGFAAVVPGVSSGLVPAAGLPAGSQAPSGLTFGGGGTQTVFNWYEEGTWTPAVNSSGTTGTVTYSLQSGYFTRIGRVVYYTFNLALATYNGAGSGNLLVSGLPYASHNDANMAQLGVISASGITASSGYTQFTGLMTNNATTLRVTQQILSATPASTTVNNVVYAGMTSTATISGSGFYFT